MKRALTMSSNSPAAKQLRNTADLLEDGQRTMANGIERSAAAERSAAIRSQVTLANALRAAFPPLLFSLRLWAAVCLALFVAFWLELDNPYWAGISAAIVCQPTLGASLRKSRYRIIGTLVGATMIVMLTVWFPQNRMGFLVGLALWGGVCAFAASLFRNFASYAAALAGYTAAIIGTETLGPTGGASGEVFMLAVTRSSEIGIGILCAGALLALTDFGGAAERLAGTLTAVSTEIAARFGATLRPGGSDSADTQQPARRELIRQVAGLDSMIDEAIGESSTIRYHSPVLQGAIDGLFASLAAWRSIAARLTKISPEVADEDANTVLGSIPEEMRSTLSPEQATLWIADPVALRRHCEAAIRTLIALPASTASLRLLADQTANVMVGFAMVLEATAVLVANPARSHSHSPSRGFKIYVPDWLPSLVSAGRAFVAIGAAELFWVLTAWPDGGSAIVFVAIAVLLLSPLAELAYAEAIAILLGTMVVIPVAAAIKFALLPGLESFPAFCLALTAFLMPFGIAMAAIGQHPSLVTCSIIFMSVLQPTNEMSYDTAQFYNSALGIFVGLAAASLSFLIVPPLSPSLRTRRLLNLTLRDLRRLAMNRLSVNANDWQGHTFSRLAALPDQAEPLERAQLLAALLVGTELIHLGHDTAELHLLDAALRTFAEGNSAAAIAQLSWLDHHLALAEQVDTQLASRARGRILAICDALDDHRAYFDTGAAV